MTIIDQPSQRRHRRFRGAHKDDAHHEQCTSKLSRSIARRRRHQRATDAIFPTFGSSSRLPITYSHSLFLYRSSSCLCFSYSAFGPTKKVTNFSLNLSPLGFLKHP